MKTLYPIQRRNTLRGYFLMEALVYIGLVMVVLGTAFAVMFRCVENSVVLSRNAEDVAAVLRAGERWRADIRNARDGVRFGDAEEGPTLILATEKGEINYFFRTNTILRRIGDGPWVKQLSNVKSSEMQLDQRRMVTNWVWNIELLPRTKGYIKAGRVRPLFTFMAVPERKGT